MNPDKLYDIAATITAIFLWIASLTTIGALTSWICILAWSSAKTML